VLAVSEKVKTCLSFFFFIQLCVVKKKSLDLVFTYIQSNQGLGKGYQPQPSASGGNPYLNLDFNIFWISKNLIQ